MGKGRRNRVLKLTPAKINYIIRAKSNNVSSRIIAIEMKVSARTVNRVWGHWVKNKEPLTPKKFGRPKTHLQEADKLLIVQIHKEQNCGARRLEKVIEHKYGKYIPHNAIHRFLLENNLAHEDKRKKKRRKPWIRYQRTYSLSAVHLDWHTSRINGKEVCVVLDDSSRFILVGGEFIRATGDVSIGRVRKVLDDFGDVRKIREVITDMARNSSLIRWTKMAIRRVHSLHSWLRTESSTSWPESSTLKPMTKLKNGIIPTRKIENYLMILTNS